MEVFLCSAIFITSCSSLLHVRGGVSVTPETFTVLVGSSPRPWRCFSKRLFPLCNFLVFSTSVEVFLDRQTDDLLPVRLLHVRGGVSHPAEKRGLIKASSPRPWRCFQKSKTLLHQKEVFSTSVEVFPSRVSYQQEPSQRLLHVRGGVSICTTTNNTILRSSPRPWRCFYRRTRILYHMVVFSTSVEVFPIGCTIRPPLRCLLHVRGGVSFAL